MMKNGYSKNFKLKTDKKQKKGKQFALHFNIFYFSAYLKLFFTKTLHPESTELLPFSLKFAVHWALVQEALPIV